LLVVAEAVQTAATVVHILLELEYFRKTELWGTASIGFAAGPRTNVVADDIEVYE